MISTDKSDFAKAMISCFQNYRANVATEMIDEWFESKLFGFQLFNVRKAFANYVDDYKNKFPPQRGQIIQLAYSSLTGELVKDQKLAGCVNLIAGNRCGEEIFVHAHCESCYDAKRPKTIADEKLAELIARAKTDGCETEREIADWSRKQMGLLPLGRKFLEMFGKGDYERSGGIIDIGNPHA